MEFNITFETNPKHSDTEILWSGISKYAWQMRGHEAGKSFAFFVRDTAEQIKGGGSGFVFYGCCYVDLLWIDSKLREKGYGTKLMESIEKLAAESNCNFIAVNTMDWEALGFYKKLGFYIEFERRGFDKDSIFFF